MSLFDLMFGSVPEISTVAAPYAPPINFNTSHVSPMVHHHIHDLTHENMEEEEEEEEEKTLPTNHSRHGGNKVLESNIRKHKYNHTYLDHIDEMPEELQDFINEHYNGNFVMESISPDANLTFMNGTNNVTMGEFDSWPQWKKTLDVVTKYVLTFNVLGTMLGMGCAIYWREVVSNMWPPIGILIGMVGQFIVLPATGFGFSVLFKLKPYEALGALIVSCSPGGSFSNFFTYWVEGDLALSIVMTACSSIIAFGGMPLNFWLYSSYYLGSKASDIVIPYMSIFKALAFICGPVVVGMVIRHFSQKIAKVITQIFSIVAYAGFIFVLVSWIFLYWKVFTTATPLIYAGAVLLPVTGFTAAYIVAFIFRRTHKICRTIGIETGSQNMPVALSIIFLSFDDQEATSKMLLFPTLYGIFMLVEIFGGIIVYYLVKLCMKRRKKKNEEANDYPLVYQARIENGTPIEKQRLND
ncbi:Ileal sodium/bile acid cotransporter [Armadillidium nasatum]|uniref:Ileal sodium/bile acid cotransporter n=1 Tax=Armadillidium nasatum TaxID=96803 RepID=A0A5N5T8Y6_9CRUS|nr:Ileal sodium/bile acid cotransporter [Armadillidium nasatum]